MSEITDRLVHEAITHTNQKQLEKAVYGLRDEIQQLETALREIDAAGGYPANMVRRIARDALNRGTATIVAHAADDPETQAALIDVANAAARRLDGGTATPEPNSDPQGHPDTDAWERLAP